MLYTAVVNSIFDGYDNVAKTIVERTNLSLDTQGKVGNTLLMWAAYFGNLNIVQELIKKGANVNIVNMEGDNAISLATKKGYREIASLLRTYKDL